MTSKILTHPSDLELAAAVHENLYALFQSMQALPGSEVVESAKLSYHHASPTNPMFKGVWRARLEPVEVEGTINAVIAWFNQRDAPYFFWWTDSETKPADLNERLLQRGFDGNLIGEPGMVADLYAINEKIRNPDGFNVVQAVDQRTLGDWRDIFSDSFETSLSDGQAWMDATRSAGLAKAPWKTYVGYLHGKPVATSILFNGAGVAGIYGIGTLSGFRRRGIGGAITVKTMMEARDQGYRYAVLFSSHMGFSLYKRLGFREVDNKIGIYILEKDE